MKNIKKNIEIRRFLEWSKIVRGKPIQIRLYEFFKNLKLKIFSYQQHEFQKYQIINQYESF